MPWKRPTPCPTPPRDDPSPTGRSISARRGSTTAGAARRRRPVVFDVDDLSVYYGVVPGRARRRPRRSTSNEITAFIGPSGCGKTTVLRCFNRMNDLIDGARVEGTIRYHGVDLYDAEVNPVEVRRRIGMVFQKPNPFPKSIYDNVAYGPKHRRHRRASSTTSSSRRCAAPRCGTR